MSHFRVVIQLIHVKSGTEQPELLSCSLPGFQAEAKAELFYHAVVDAAERMQKDYHE